MNGARINLVNNFAARRQSGALLLTVALLLAVMAALAFSLGRGAGMGAHSVASDYDRRSAAYLAQAAVAAAKWTNQVNKCGNASIGSFSLGGGSTSANVTKAKGAINVVASATSAGGAATTVTRTVGIVDLTNSESKNLGGGVRDTTIGPLLLLPQNFNFTLALNSTPLVGSNALLYWPMTDIPNNSQVLAATLALTQSVTSNTPRAVNIQRVTTIWDQNALWTRARPGVSWNGGDYAATPAAVANAGNAATVQWNVTGLVDSWVDGRLPNDGMLLRLAGDNQAASFYSFEASDGSRRPVLSVTFAKPCS